MTDSDATQGDNMSPAEFAKLMGAYPQPAENPLPTYGGYMDNSPANFAWVNNNDYFGAEEDYGWVITHKDSGLRTDSFRTKSQAEKYRDELKQNKTLRTGMKIVKANSNDEAIPSNILNYLDEKSMGAENDDQIKIFYEGIYTNDDEDDEREGQEIMSHSLVSKKDYQEYYEDTKWNPCACDEQGCLSCFLEYYPHTPEIKNGVITSYGSLWFEDAELNALDAEEGESYNAESKGNKTVMCDFCSEKKPLGQMKRMPYDPEQDKRVRYSGYLSTYAICNGCYRDRMKGKPVGKSVLHAETFEGEAAIILGDDNEGNPVGYVHVVGHEDKKGVTPTDIHTGTSAVSPQEMADILNKGFGKIRKDFKMNAETFEAFSIDEDDEGKIHIENKCDDCGKEFRLTQNPYIVGGNRAGAIVYENLDGITGHDYPEYSPYGDLLCKACWKINREEDELFGEWNAETFNGLSAEEYYAEMEELTDGVASITNRFGDGVGIIQVDDEDLEDVSVEITDGDGDVVYEGILGDEDTPEIEEDDYYFSEDKKKSSILPMALGIAGAIFAYQPVMDFLARKTKKEEKMAETPELIENPNTGNLDPAQYEELVVESTGYAVDVIPQVLDGSFMGSRFAALPTERYVEYSDPGIGAHTDIAMNRDEIYLEPEMAMVQASESVKESQAPGQSPYNSVDGEENRDFDMRVLKETQVISLDPAVKPFIPQSMSGYTGNANTPPSVYDKMFNIGVLGQTPAFVPGSGDIGSSHTGSRSAIPNSLGVAGSVGGPLSDKVNANYTDGTTSMSLAQWAIENTVSQSSDTEAVVIDRSSGQMKRVRRV